MGRIVQEKAELEGGRVGRAKIFHNIESIIILCESKPSFHSTLANGRCVVTSGSALSSSIKASQTRKQESKQTSKHVSPAFSPYSNTLSLYTKFPVHFELQAFVALVCVFPEHPLSRRQFRVKSWNISVTYVTGVET